MDVDTNTSESLLTSNGGFDAFFVSYSPTSSGPQAPVILSPTNGTTYNGTVTVSGTAEAGGTVNVYIDDMLIAAASVSADGSWTLPPSSGLTAGNHAVRATLTDSTGRTSRDSESVAFIMSTSDVPSVSVQAQRVRGKPGKRVRLKFIVTSEVGLSGETKVVKKMSKTLKTYQLDLDTLPAGGLKSVTWTLPRRAKNMDGYRFCVVSTNGVGSQSSQSCASIVVK